MAIKSLDIFKNKYGVRVIFTGRHKHGLYQFRLCKAPFDLVYYKINEVRRIASQRTNELQSPMYR